LPLLHMHCLPSCSRLLLGFHVLLRLRLLLNYDLPWRELPDLRRVR
jgi:hypothetical protein